MSEKLYFGDNLTICRKYIDSESVDLIYLDPPFNSNASYNVLFGEAEQSGAQIQAFNDTWHWGPESRRAYDEVVHSGGSVANLIESFHNFLGTSDMMAYLAMMAPRLLEFRRILKPNGSIMLHCDPTAGDYLKLLMDSIFGPKNFRNQIVWAYSGAASPRQKHFNRKHDLIYWYTKGDEWTFRPYELQIPFAESTKKRAARKDGSFGQERSTPLSKFKFPDDWWADIPPLKAHKERLGYPTQKPKKLLERIIESCTEPGGLVLDPFCGCGTAVHAAHKLGRNWIGIDITHVAIGLIEHRLFDAFGIQPEVVGVPEDLEGAVELFNRDEFQFEAWAVTRIPGIKPNERQTGDRGVDGVGRFYKGRDKNGKERYGRIVVSVKGGKNIGPNHIRDFRGSIERDNADMGIFICLKEPTKAMIAEAAEGGSFTDESGQDIPRIQIYRIEDYFSGKFPILPGTIQEWRKKAGKEGDGQEPLI